MYNVSKSAIGVLDTKNYIKNVKSRCIVLYINTYLKYLVTILHIRAISIFAE